MMFFDLLCIRENEPTTRCFDTGFTSEREGKWAGEQRFAPNAAN
jgi:hypothetical protein